MRARSKLPLLSLLFAPLLACDEVQSADAGASLPDAAVAPVDAASPDLGISAPDAAPESDSGVVEETEDTEITTRFQLLADTFDDERQRLGAPGAALAILEDGRVTFARGFGSKHFMRNEPVHGTTLFRIGSCTKMMTATLLLQAVAAGTVDLEAPITDVVPEFSFTSSASDARLIKVRHLLTHSSAINDYLEVDVPAAQKEDGALESYLTGAMESLTYLMAPPGRMYNYSNPNFYLAGLLAEKRLQGSYRQLMRERVYAPLSMRRTSFSPAEVIADGDFAYGKTRNQAGQFEAVAPDSYDNAWARPAGYAYSSAREMAKFLLFLEDGNPAVLPDQERNAMQSEQVATQELLDLTHYGYGLAIYRGVFLGGLDQFRAMKVVTHDGAIPGYSAELWYVPSLRFGFVAMASTDGAYFVQSFITALNTLTTLPTATTAPDLSVNPETLDSLTGTYRDDYNVGKVQVDRQGSSLSIQAPDLDAAGIPYTPLLQPLSPDNFVLTAQGIQIQVTFLRDAQGNGEYMRARFFVAHRISTLWSGAPGRRAFDRRRFLEALKVAPPPSPLLYPAL